MTFTTWLTWPKVAILAILFGAVLSLTGCGKFTEPFKDADVAGRNDDAAIIGTMPDGFNNWAFKCNGTDGVYTTYHGDSAYGGIAVIPNDKNCADAR